MSPHLGCTAMYGDALKACENMQSMRIDDAFTAWIAWNGKCIHFGQGESDSLKEVRKIQES
jgi:hypothetical protein